MLVFGSALVGQEKGTMITKNFKFEDGVYLTFEQLTKNQPNYDWGDLDVQLVTSSQTFMTQVESLQLKDGSEIDIDQLWGIVIDGIPYIKLPKEAVDKPLPTFAGIRVRGRICYFSYETRITEPVKISAYNPLTGRPFRTAQVPKTEVITVKKILSFVSGQVADFNRENLLLWIERDKKLSKTVRAVSDEGLDDKLFKAILIFDDRHPVFIQN